ncbi:MAG: hypothetical protein HYY24_21155 [Verrucomicrobia bacterium]|nr:hypothetical protein [Verrucomicrobiota bacterium]
MTGNYAYVADRDAGLQVVDVSNPAKPQRVGGYDTSSWASGVAVAGNYAYVADSLAGQQVIDVSNPAQPQRVGANSAFEDAFGVSVSGDNVYVAAGSNGLVILNLFSPVAPRLLNPVWGQSGFGFTLSGPAGATLRVQRSVNLRDWEDWQSVTLRAQPSEVSDADAATASSRFYRAVAP